MMRDEKDVIKGVLWCGESIRLPKDVEARWRALAARQGHVLGPIRTLEDALYALFAGVSAEDQAQMLAFLEEIEALQLGDEDENGT